MYMPRVGILIRYAVLEVFTCISVQNIIKILGSKLKNHN